MANKSFSNVKVKVNHLDLSKDTARSILVSGENISHSLGKIARWYKDISWVGHTHTKSDITDFAHTHSSFDSSVNKGSENQPVYILNGVPTAIAYTINASVPTNAVFTDTNTKVTSVGNHYTPSGGTTTSASGGTLTDITNSANGVQVVTGVTKDAAGHVTGVTSIALKSVNSNTTYAAGTGISMGSGNVINHANSITAVTTAAFKKFKYDAQGHITGTADVAAADLPSHNHTKSDITDFPTSMPASDVYSWAKAATKPTYTASEVGAAASSHTHISLKSNTDNRSVATKPNDYNSVFNVTGLKYNESIGIDKNTYGLYSGVFGMRGWSDSSGGMSHEFALAGEADRVLHRSGSTTSWNNGWKAFAYTSDIPTTLPASDVYAWAKASTKPTYTASEVGAAAASHIHVVGDITGGTNKQFLMSNGTKGEWHTLAKADIPALDYIPSTTVVLTGGSQTSTSSADGGNNVFTFNKSDGSTATFTVKNGTKGSQGIQGIRGTGFYSITTAPESYTTAVGGFTPTYRIALATVKTQSKANDILVGDQLRYSYYTYPVGYVDANYVYLGARVSIRGATGAAGAAATISVGNVTTGAAGSSATVTNSGTTAAAVLDFSIPKGDTGAKGDPGTGIKSVVQTTTATTSGGTNVITVTLTDNSTSTFDVKNGVNGTSAVWFTGTTVTGTATSGISASVSGSKAGDMYYNTSNANVYKATAANIWGYVGCIKGKDGTSPTLPTFSAEAGTNAGTVGTPSVSYNNGKFTFNYLKGAKGDKGDPGTPAPTYSASDGIKLDGTAFKHTNAITAVTTAAFKKFKYDAQGHITGTADVAKSDIPSLDYVPNTHATTTYGTCSTAAATAAKVVTLATNGAWTLKVGAIIAVKFTETNTANNPTLNVNNTGAKPVYYNTAVLTTASLSYAGYANRVHIYAYDGTNYVYLGHSVDSNTTYSNMTAATASAAGKNGLVPAPAAGAQTYFLRGDATWVNITPSLIGAAAASHDHTYIKSKDNYTFTSSTLPNSFDYGLSVGFVKNDSGFGNYGTVLTARTYSGGGGTLQLYAPYSEQYGGTHMKARFGDYAVSTGNSWTSLKEIAWVSDIPTTPADIGAAASSHNHSADNITSGTLANDRLPVRLREYRTNATTIDTTVTGFSYANESNSPFKSLHTSNTDYMILTQGYSTSWGSQIATDFRTNNLAIRVKNNGTWSSWSLVSLEGHTHTAGNITGGTNKQFLMSNGTTGEWHTLTKADITALGIPGSDTNTTYSAGTGLALSGTTFYTTIPRVTKDSKAFPGANKVIFEEYSSGDSYNLPSNAWYHIISMQGNDVKYGTQLALGMTANNKMYFRNYNNSTWSDWNEVSIAHSHPYVNTKNATATNQIQINPTSNSSNSYNEGLRIGKASNNWSNINFGCSNSATSGTQDGQWLVGARGAAGSKSGAAGDFTIENNGSTGTGLTLYKNGDTPTWNGTAFSMSGHTHSYLPLSGGTMTGNLMVQRGSTEQPQVTVNNGSVKAGLLVGSGAVNRGLYDFTTSQWMVYHNGTSVVLNGNANTANKWSTARTLTIGSTGKSVDGSGNVSWTLAEIGAAASSHTHSYAKSESVNGPAYSVAGTSGTTESYRHVWFSVDSDDTRRAYNDNFTYEPANGIIKFTGWHPKDLTGSTVNLNDYTDGSGKYGYRRYICKTTGGGNNISNKPSDSPFVLEIILIRWASTTDYITKQIYHSYNKKTYQRFCTNGTWDTWSEIKITDTVYTHPSHTAASSGLYKITVNSLGHVTAATAVTKADITALGIPGSDTNTNTTYSFATGDNSGSFKVTPSGGSASNIQIKGLTHVAGDANGHGIIVQNNGLTMVGAGESATALQSAESLGGATEQLYLTSDNDIYLYTNCQTIANRKYMKINTSAQLEGGSGGSWIAARNSATVKNYSGTDANDNSYHPVVSVYTNAGEWSIGTLGAKQSNHESLYISYTTNANYTAGTNSASYYRFDTNGTYSGRVANSDNCKTTVTDPSSNVSYGVIFAADPATTEDNALRKSNSFRLNHSVGAANTEGLTELVLGNNVAKTAANNSSGQIAFYNANGKWAQIKPGSNTENVTVTLPTSTGSMTNIVYKTAKTASAVTNTGWTNNATDDNIVPTMSFMAYWNGRYNSSSSNLQYCDRGRFGTIVTAGSGDYLAISGGTMTGDIAFAGVTSTTYPAASNGISFSGSTDGAKIFYRVIASDQGELVLRTTDDSNCIIRMENSHASAKNTIKFDPYNSYIYANYFNAGCSAETPTTSSYIIYANSDGWFRKSTLANVKTILGLGSAAYTASTAYAAASHTHSQYYDSDTSRTANTVLAAPNGSAGSATFRALVAADLPASGATAGSYGPSANASPAHSGTFSVPYLTVDAKGRVTAISTKTITLPASGNTDAKVTQTISTANAEHRILMSATADDTTRTEGAIKDAGFRFNPSTNRLILQGSTETAPVYGSTGPALRFLNASNEQGIELIYCDYDSYYNPSSLTLTGLSSNGDLNRVAFISPRLVAFDQKNTKSIADIYISTTGTAATADAASTQGEAVIRIGNEVAAGAKGTTTGAGNSRGRVRIYGTGTYYTDILTGSLSANRTITLPNATGTVSLDGHTHSYIPLAGSTAVTGEIVTTSANGFRLVNGSYGAFLRNDGTEVWFLITAKGASNDVAKTATWADVSTLINSAHPFRIHLADGRVYINGYTIDKSVPSNAAFTDSKVRQSSTTTSNYRGVVLGYTNNTDGATGRETDVTNETYITNKIFAQPSTGTLYATNLYAWVSGSADVAVGLYRSGVSSWRLLNNSGTLYLQNNYYSSATQSWYNVMKFNFDSSNKIEIPSPPTATSTNRSLQLTSSEVIFVGCDKAGWASGTKWTKHDGTAILRNGVYGNKDGSMNYMFLSEAWDGTANTMRFYKSATGLVTSCANGLRMVSGGYGVFFRNDGSDFYLLLTDKKTDGTEWTASYNSKRPFYVNLSSGLVTMKQGLMLSGGITFKTTNSTGAYLTTYDTGNSYNQDVVFNSTGSMIIGSGESAAAIYENNIESIKNSENMSLSSDADAFIYTNANTITKRRRFKFTSDGNIVMTGAEGDWKRYIDFWGATGGTTDANHLGPTSSMIKVGAWGYTSSLYTFFVGDVDRFYCTINTFGVFAGTGSIYGSGQGSVSGLTKHKGVLGVHNGNDNYYACIEAPTSLSDYITCTLPNRNGTLALVGDNNHTHSYLPLSGGTMTGTISSSVNTSTYLNSNKGTNVIINSTNTAGAYTMLAKMNSTNGYMTIGTYQTRFELHYTAKTTVDAGTNNVTKNATLLDESGNASWPGTITAASFSGTATRATNSDNCKTTVTDPSTSTSYGIIFAADPNATEDNALRKSNDFRLNHFRGAANTEGLSEIVLGNSTAKTAANNSTGRLGIYNGNGNWVHLNPGTNTSNIDIYLPASAGTMTSMVYQSVSELVRHCRAVHDADDVASKPWHKVASINVAGTNQDRNAVFLVTSRYNTRAGGILIAHVRVGGTAGVTSAVSLRWIVRSSQTEFNSDKFQIRYTDKTGSSQNEVTVEIWCKIETRYYAFGFDLISANDRHTTNGSHSAWTLNSDTTGSASYTAGTGGSASVIAKIANNSSQALGAKSANGYYGMTDPDLADNVWIRTTSQGIIPYQSGAAGSGHGSLGTSSWYFANAYIDKMHGTADRATNSDQCKTTVTNPDSATAYGVIFAADPNASEDNVLRKTNNIRVQQRNGTTSSEGYSELLLGNSTAKGSANNSTGWLGLFGDSSYLMEIAPAAGMTAGVTIRIPATSGTLAMGPTTLFSGTAASAVTLSASVTGFTSLKIFCKNSAKSEYFVVTIQAKVDHHVVPGSTNQPPYSAAAAGPELFGMRFVVEDKKVSVQCSKTAAINSSNSLTNPLTIHITKVLGLKF